MKVEKLMIAWLKQWTIELEKVQMEKNFFKESLKI